MADSVRFTRERDGGGGHTGRWRVATTTGNARFLGFVWPDAPGSWAWHHPGLEPGSGAKTRRAAVTELYACLGAVLSTGA